MKTIATFSACLAIAGQAQAEPPSRIVAAGGDLTEIVYALGAADRLVGVDSTSNYPPEAVEKEQIGYVRAISAEGVLSLQPDLLLGAYDTAPVAALDQLRAAGLSIALAPSGHSIEGVAEKVRFVGEQLALEAEAEELARNIEAEMARVTAEVAQYGDHPRVLFLLAIREGAPMAGGEGSSAEVIIELAGGVNAANGFEGYKPMSREAILSGAPDVLLMMDTTAERLGGVDTVLDRPELATTPAGLNRNSVLMDGMLLLGFGPRTPEAVAELSRALHPAD